MNSKVIFGWITNEIKINNIGFKEYFNKYSCFVSCICLFSIIDINNIRILISNIFDIKLFNAPIKLENIAYLRYSHIFSLLFENLPQILVQFYLHFWLQFNWSGIAYIATIISVIDLIYAVISVVLWYAFAQREKKDQHKMKGPKLSMNDMKHKLLDS